jgi:hypothetical protein
VSVWIAAILLGGVYLFLVNRSLSRSAWWDSIVQEHRQEEEAKREERIGDTVATDILDSPYCLFLRPFRLTGRFSCQARDPFSFCSTLRHDPFSGGFWQPVEPDVDIETLLKHRLKLNFMALGHITEPSRSSVTTWIDDPPPRALRLYLDNAKWWPDFVTLAEGATLIVVVPDASDNCVREVNWLRTEELLSKCLFYMRGSVRRFDTWYEPEWNKAVERFREVGIWLPQYNPAGAIFTLHLAGTVKKLVTLDFTKAVYKSNSLRDRLMLLGEPVSSYVSSHSVGLYRSEWGPRWH